MSFRLMVAMFELDISASEKLVLLAMSDHAHEDGTGCYPSIGTLARKTSLTERGVQKIMRRLEKAKLISPVVRSNGGGRGRTTEYKITPQNPEPGSPFPDTNPEPGSPFPDTKTPNRKTVNPEPEGQKPRTRRSETPNRVHPNLSESLGTGREPAAADVAGAFGGAVDSPGGESGKERGRSSSSPSKTPGTKTDDGEGAPDQKNGPSLSLASNSDSTPETEEPKPTATPTPKPKIVLLKKVKPALRAWMRGRILGRAEGEVHNPHAYVKAAETEFLENLDAEVEEYLCQVAERFISDRCAARPGQNIPFADTFAALDREARNHQLPLADEEIFLRATRAATELLGMTEVEVKKDCDASRQKNGAKPGLHCATCGRTEKWHRGAASRIMHAGKKQPGYGRFVPNSPAPTQVRTTFCAACGRTKSQHMRAEKHPEREPEYDGHAFDLDEFR